MLGNNAKAAVQNEHQTHFDVYSIHHSIQGTGPFAGEPAAFVLFSGCNLQCKFCDEGFEDVRESLTAKEITQKITELRINKGPFGLVVLTGGEPLRQHIKPLVECLNNRAFRIQVETAGTLWNKDLDDLFVTRSPDGTVPVEGNTLLCSPKTPRLAEGIHSRIHALKYTCLSQENCIKDGLPVFNTQKLGSKEARVIRPKHITGPPIHPTQIYIQPCIVGNELGNAVNLNKAAQVCMRYGYRLSVRLNTIARLP